MNAPVQVFAGYVLSFLMGRYLRMELLGCIGEPQGRRSLVGCRLWGPTESDTTEAT